MKRIIDWLKDFNNKYFGRFAHTVLGIFASSLIILLVSKLWPAFADFFNRYISSAIRFVLSYITKYIPFSVGETIFLCLPLIFFVLIYLYIKKYSDDDIKAGRFLVTMFCCVAIMFTTHILSFGIAYNCTDLDKRLGMEAKEVSTEELEYTALAVRSEMQELLSDIDFGEDGASRMPYSFSELNDKLNEAYSIACDKYTFIPRLDSNVKLLSVSPVMTYTHISGIYTYYTGEANLNFNYPDYSFPYTMAHEMAHQRGVAPEDEANFVAFLVCMESDDPYIRYSAYMNIYEYLLSVYRTADSEGYSAIMRTTDLRVKREMIAFSDFFDKYRDSTASEVSNAINDTYLKASGEKAGSQSYGLVVDLACAYYHQ